MNTSMKLRFFAAPVALALLGLPAFGCDQVAAAQGDICCTEFTPGADLSAVDWKIEGDQKISFGAFMQAAADFTGAASATVTDLTAACQQLAVDLGADEKAVKETNPAKRATAWCKLATDQLNEKVKGKIELSYQPPSCTVNINAQASCEANCNVDASCMGDLGSATVRCDPGQLSGKCDGECTAKCEGSANLAVTCDGTCDGTCEGMCEGKASGGRCEGNCAGTCRGTCNVKADAKVKCEGDCTGGCSVEVRAPKCKGELKEPDVKCKADASCSGSCQASASARAECKEPALEITSTLDPQVIASLKLGLPRILSIADARSKLLVKNAKAMLDFGADFTGSADISKLSLKAGACIIPAGNSVEAALENVNASLTASASVVASLK